MFFNLDGGPVCIVIPDDDPKMDAVRKIAMHLFHAKDLKKIVQYNDQVTVEVPGSDDVNSDTDHFKFLISRDTRFKKWVMHVARKDKFLPLPLELTWVSGPTSLSYAIVERLEIENLLLHYISEVYSNGTVFLTAKVVQTLFLHYFNSETCTLDPVLVKRRLSELTNDDKLCDLPPRPCSFSDALTRMRNGMKATRCTSQQYHGYYTVNTNTKEVFFHAHGTSVKAQFSHEDILADDWIVIE